MNEKANSPENDIRSWVFLSHSNDDYDKVAFVRNYLEQQHKRPIMFFLKCMENRKELDNLLKREIDAREEFILCDSKNARASDWVQEEVNYIKAKQRKYQTIHIDEPFPVIEKELSTFISRSKIFISYRRKDRETANLITQALRERGFYVFYDCDSLTAGENFVRSISEAIRKSGENGYQLILLSDETDPSIWVDREVQMIFHQEDGRWAIPVKIHPGPLPLDNSTNFLAVSSRNFTDVGDIQDKKQQAQLIVEAVIEIDKSLSE